MDLEFFNSTVKRYSLVVFLQEQDVPKYQPDLEKIGLNDKIKVIVQPCPFEGIEFLYRTLLEFPDQIVSMDKDVYWHAIPYSTKLSAGDLDVAANHHYELLVAILNQNVQGVDRHRKALESFLKK